MNNKNKEIKNFIIFIFLISIILFIIFLIPTEKKEKNKINKEIIKIKEIGQGFIYYENKIYYKHAVLVVLNEKDVGESIGKVSYQLKQEDIKDNNFTYYNDNKIYGYALTPDTEVFKHKKNNQAILIKTDININNYYVYLEDIPSNNFNYDNFDYIQSNDNIIKNISLVGFGKKDIPLSLKISDFSKTDENYSNNGFIDGYIEYYLLVEIDGFYLKYYCNGNIYSNNILLLSSFYENNNLKENQYIYENKDLSNILQKLYSNYY